MNYTMDFLEREVSQIAEERARIILSWQSSSSSSSSSGNNDGSRRRELQELELIWRLERRAMELARLVAGETGNLRGAYLATEYAILGLLGRELMKPNNDKNAKRKEVEEEVEGLEKVIIIDAGDVCVVCQEEMEVGEDARAMDCSHTFHSTCLKEWIRRKPNCPLCRYDRLTSSNRTNIGAKRRRLSRSS